MTLAAVTAPAPPVTIRMKNSATPTTAQSAPSTVPSADAMYALRPQSATSTKEPRPSRESSAEIWLSSPGSAPETS